MPVTPDPNINYDLLTKPVFLFAALPPAALNQGTILWISDLTTNPAVTSGQVAVGGGTTKGRVLSDGTAWRIHGWS